MALPEWDCPKPKHKGVGHIIDQLKAIGKLYEAWIKPCANPRCGHNRNGHSDGKYSSACLDVSCPCFAFKDF